MKIILLFLILMVCITLISARRHRPKPETPQRPRPPIPHRPPRPRVKRETKDSHSAMGTCTVKLLTKANMKKKPKSPDKEMPGAVMMTPSPKKRMPLFMNSKFLQFMLAD
ncbi:uncharacterized protein LOC131664847 [Phymastichus coffea]|uniref:uncharacterized protein LOC131664847 n=1 Tax=Phymastichus coffea TaxID=108790 RepID=UPI00273BE3B6|nr:uncharacterized protein LOC131664847 [Phymastichus coffea]